MLGISSLLEVSRQRGKRRGEAGAFRRYGGRNQEETVVDRDSLPAKEWKWRTAFVIAAMLASGVVLYTVSEYAHDHRSNFYFIDTLLQSSPLTELAGSLIVIPIVYLLIESVLDQKFKKEISESLRNFVAEPTSIIPHIEADKLDGFTSQLLDKIFLNKSLSDAFVKNVNKHRDRLLNPITDYRIQSFLSEYSHEYFKIETIFTQNKRSRSANNVVVGCKKTDLTGEEMLFIDVYENIDYDFMWTFVPCNSESKLSDSKFTINYVRIDGDKVEMFDESSPERIVFRSRETEGEIGTNSVIEMSFSVLQRRSLAGVSYGVSRPVSALTVDLSYSELKADKVDVWSNLAGVGTTRTMIRHDNKRKTVNVRHNDWLMIGSGLVFSWIYKTE
jgi:hypothetical protein